jgi:2-hydroxy-4-carboxymuconate semialdehyde hemiacetal dehydrogenase
VKALKRKLLSDAKGPDSGDLSNVHVDKGIELQDREFIAAIREGREPNAVLAMLACYEVLDQIESQLS